MAPKSKVQRQTRTQPKPMSVVCWQSCRSFEADTGITTTDIATSVCLTPLLTHSSSRGARADPARRQRSRNGKGCVERLGRALPAPVHEACALAADPHVRSVRALVVCDVPRARDIAVAHRASGNCVRRVPGAHLHHLS